MIHPSAVVDPSAELADDVTIGPGCVVVGPVRLGAGVQLMANVFLQGPLTVGERTRFWPGACVGCDPQDYKVKPGFPTAGVTIGSDCLIDAWVGMWKSTPAGMKFGAMSPDLCWRSVVSPTAKLLHSG